MALVIRRRQSGQKHPSSCGSGGAIGGSVVHQQGASRSVISQWKRAPQRGQVEAGEVTIPNG